MDTALSQFIRQYVLVLCASCLPVLALTFVALPLSLGVHPGEASTTAQIGERHMT